MKRSGVLIAVVLLVAILFAGNGLLIAHAAGPNGQGAGASDHSNSGNGHNTGSGANDHSSGSNNGGNSQGSGTVDQNLGTNDPSSQLLSLGIGGGVMDLGSQHYIIQQSGEVILANLSNPYNPTETLQINSTTSHLNYNLNAMVRGTSVNGYTNFHLTGSIVDGLAIQISGNGPIIGMMTAVCLPSGSTTGSCQQGDTSAVPAYFVGNESIQVTLGTSHLLMRGVPMLFESAYLNPFGAPIALGTADNFATLLVVTAYSHATIDWSNVVDGGNVLGTLGSESTISGKFVQVAQEHENLVTGNATDHGTMTFFDMSNASLDSSGQYSGTSSTPTTQHPDCSTSIGFPAESGMCTSYEFQSSGGFHMNSLVSQGVHIAGVYSTSWPIPAFTFGGTITATVS